MKVLVATDGSEPAARACRLLTGYAPRDADIRILTVLSYDRYPRPLVDDWQAVAPSETAAQEREAVEVATAECRAILEPDHPHVSVGHRYGNPSNEIVAEIERWDPDLVVMGRRGLRGLDALIGSTSEHVLHHVKVPVLIAP